MVPPSAASAALKKPRKNSSETYHTSSVQRGSPAAKGSATEVTRTQGVQQQSSGRWTPEEHARFLEALDRFGRDWRKIQDFVGTRTSAQARSHAQKYFGKLARRAMVNQTAEVTTTGSYGSIACAQQPVMAPISSPVSAPVQRVPVMPHPQTVPTQTSHTMGLGLAEHLQTVPKAHQLHPDPMMIKGDMVMKRDLMHVSMADPMMDMKAWPLVSEKYSAPVSVPLPPPIIIPTKMEHDDADYVGSNTMSSWGWDGSSSISTMSSPAMSPSYPSDNIFSSDSESEDLISLQDLRKVGPLDISTDVPVDSIIDSCPSPSTCDTKLWEEGLNDLLEEYVSA